MERESSEPLSMPTSRGEWTLLIPGVGAVRCQSAKSHVVGASPNQRWMSANAAALSPRAATSCCSRLVANGRSLAAGAS